MGKSYKLRHRFKTRPCPQCGTPLDFDAIKVLPEKCFVIYECPNGCELEYEQQYVWRKYVLNDFYYEEVVKDEEV